MGYLAVSGAGAAARRRGGQLLTTVAARSPTRPHPRRVMIRLAAPARRRDYSVSLATFISEPCAMIA